jgi:hypothetical protein
MTSHDKIVSRFAAEAGKPGARLLRGLSQSIFVNPHDNRTLCSWGTHFPLAQIMPGDCGDRSWWLLNGDNYSFSTSRHQQLVRAACERTGLPVLIVPFSCLRAARIDRETIIPADIQPDGHEEQTHHADALTLVPESNRWNARQTAGGQWEWTTYRHWLGASVFRAAYNDRDDQGQPVTRTACFLSAFDEQEPRRHYFLCQLPQDSAPATIAEALEALKPAEVIAAEAAGLPVTRQGDVFAIPAGIPTRQVPGKTARGAYLLDVNHTATEVRTADDGTTYARGILRHAPRWRDPEHQRRAIGDRRTWHQIVKNTVPAGSNGASRSWSLGGNVD